MRPAGRLSRLFAIGVGLVAATMPVATRAESDDRSAELCKAMIEAHGGMEKWREASAVTFTDQWETGGAPGPRVRTVVEQSSRRAYLEVLGTSMRVTWDGQRAWSVDWQMPTPPRFLALLNYYFLNLPWLTRDPGVNLAYEGTATLWDDPTEYHLVRMTFDAGVGDTPDDYYVLYIHPDTHMLHANRYVVTYNALLPEGVSSTPEHILVYDGYATVGGLTVPTHFTIYETDRSVYAACAISDWSFAEPFDMSRMVMPENAVVDESTP